MDNLDEKQIQDHFVQLPKVVRDAITSADIEKHLREIADTYKLHLDQWNLLENQVMLTLMGLQRAENLKANIMKNVGVEDSVAGALSQEISRVVFDPVRSEMERQLEHPDAQAKTETGVEQMTAQALSAREAAAPAPAPITPVSTAPENKSVRAPISEVYKPGETSSARKDIVNDPYRESPK